MRIGGIPDGAPSPYIHGKDPASCPGIDGSYPLLCHLLDAAVIAEHLWRTRVRSRLRKLIADTLTEAGFDGDAMLVLVLAAALHDVGKANPWFQYQERHSAAADFAHDLAESTGLPTSPPRLRQMLRVNWEHPLRRHEFVSHRVVTGHWPDNADRVTGAHWFGMLVGGHHGYWRSPVSDDVVVDHAGDELLSGWAAQQGALLRSVEAAIGLSVTSIPALPTSSAGSAVFACLSGLVTLADWIASDDAQVDAGKHLWSQLESESATPHLGEDESRAWMDRRGTDLRAHADRCLGVTSTVDSDELRRVVLGSFEPRPLQAEALAMDADTDPGLWICMYPTGDGKTEAALLRGAAAPDEGFFFGLPTLATTDAMEDRLLQLGHRLGAGALPLIKSHQFADLMRSAPGHESSETRAGEECCDEPLSAWYSTSMRKLVAPNVVGTVDQALTGALAQRHLTFRLFGLANRHVILDEVHTFDAYQTDLLVELLYWWGVTRTRVTLLSATLPARHMNRMVESYRAGLNGVAMATELPERDVPFPATVSVAWDGEVDVRGPHAPLERIPQPTVIELVDLATRHERIDSHRQWAANTAAAHPDSPIAIVTNVVADCLEIASALASDPSVTATHDVLCLHSRMVTGHRSAVERHLATRAGKQAHRAGFGPAAKPVLVVGTQVIQASLDFDVDFLATDLAPAPDLLQRLGRAWRFEGIIDGPPRGGRLPADADRALRIVSVVGTDDRVIAESARPYLAAVLDRTRTAITREVARGPLVGIYGFSQTWVDAAFNTDPYSFLSDDEEARRAMEEMVDHQSRTGAATLSRAALARPGHEGTFPLLAPSPHRRGATWESLVRMTRRNDDPDLMRTRFIEQESMRVMLLDSRSESSFLDPGSSDVVQFPANSAASLLTSNFEHLQHWFIGLPASLRSAAEQAVRDTLGGTEWRPRAKWMKHCPPLDLAHLHGFTYDPISGLRKD